MPPSHFPRCSVTDIFSEVFRQSDTVFPPFYNFRMRQNLWPNALAKLCGAALNPLLSALPRRKGRAAAVYGLSLHIQPERPFRQLERGNFFRRDSWKTACGNLCAPCGPALATAGFSTLSTKYSTGGCLNILPSFGELWVYINFIHRAT